jgi:Xaa-Pro aminopeptidase
MEVHHLDYIIAVQRTDYLGGYVKWFTDLPTSWEYTSMVIFSKDKKMTTIWHGSPMGDNSPPQFYSRGIVKKYAGGQLPSLNFTCTQEAEWIVQELEPKGAVRIGIAGLAYMTVQCYNYLISHLTKATIIDFTDQIDELRAVKSEEEIQLIKETVQLQDEVMAGVKALIQRESANMTSTHI